MMLHENRVQSIEQETREQEINQELVAQELYIKSEPIKHETYFKEELVKQELEIKLEPNKHETYLKEQPVKQELDIRPEPIQHDFTYFEDDLIKQGSDFTQHGVIAFGSKVEQYLLTETEQIDLGPNVNQEQLPEAELVDLRQNKRQELFTEAGFIGPMCGFWCDVCHESFLTEGHLDKHISRIHPVDRGDQFNEKVLTKHPNTIMYCCGQCDFKSKWKKSLSYHTMITHTEVKHYSCNSKYDLKSHVNYVHPYEKAFRCSQCQYSCKTKGNLSRHMKQIHSDERPFSCSQCRYSCKVTLSMHMKCVHSDERP